MIEYIFEGKDSLNGHWEEFTKFRKGDRVAFSPKLMDETVAVDRLWFFRKTIKGYKEIRLIIQYANNETNSQDRL